VKFVETQVPGAFVIEVEPHGDERGLFARTFCEQEFRAHGLATHFVQSSVSYNERRGTLRGMHYQAAPHGETKLVRCTAGALFDVCVDLRPDSPTRGRWVGVELTAARRNALYVPRGCAHGFLTLADHTEIHYSMDAPYVPDAARAVRWDDPAFAIEWPEPPAVLSDRDRTVPDYDPAVGPPL